MKRIFLSLLPFFLLSSCSSLRNSQNHEKQQLELTLHEVRTSLDDLRHDINCFQTEMQILDGRIKYYENALATLKQQDLEKQQIKISQISQQIQSLEKKWSSLDRVQQGGEQELKQLLSHANETTAALTQFRNRIQELEGEILVQNRRFEELAKLKGNIETITRELRASSDSYKIYKVRSGDTLEKIARLHKIPVDQIKKSNQLDQDLIVVGQELKIPEN